MRDEWTEVTCRQTALYINYQIKEVYEKRDEKKGKLKTQKKKDEDFEVLMHRRRQTKHSNYHMQTVDWERK